MDIRFTSKLKNPTDIYNLYEQLGWNGFLKLEMEKLVFAMEKSFYVLYAYEANKLVGTGRVISDGLTNAYLCGLGVLPDYRNRGIGKELCKNVVEYCKNQNLHVQFFCEENLVPYYEKMGFEVFSMGMRPK